MTEEIKEEKNEEINEEIKEETAQPEEIKEEKVPAEPETEEEAAEKVPEEDGGKKGDKKLKSKCAKLEREIEEIKKTLDETKDAHLRIAAEYDNFRKRTQREKEAIYTDAVSDTVRELLPLFDNLSLAQSYVGGENVGEGLALILKTVPDILARLNIEEFGEKGEKFDPNFHDAMMHEENEEYGEGEIVEVFRKGYKTGDKIIRHALVKVAN